MTGGEYLSTEGFLGLWQELNKWMSGAITQSGGVSSFLAEWAPEWQLVGRVCFHLAENKKDPDRPFAFLATYATGVGAGGKLTYLPLKEALKQYSGTHP